MPFVSESFPKVAPNQVTRHNLPDLRRVAIVVMATMWLGCFQLGDRENPFDPLYSGDRGKVAGQVTLRSGNALAITDGTVKLNYGGVFIRVAEFPNFVTTSARDGQFHIADIPVGTWSLEVTAPNFITASVREVNIRPDETTLLASVVELQEDIDGKLLFGSRRGGFPGLFLSDSAGLKIESLSPLPFASDWCRYYEIAGRGVLALASSYFVYEKDGDFQSASGLVVVDYPGLKPRQILNADARVRRPVLGPLGEIYFEVQEGDEVFIAKIRPREAPLLSGMTSLESFRMKVDAAGTTLGAPNDGWQEYSPTVSPSGRLAFLRTGGDPKQFEIRVHDGSPEGRLVYRNDLMTILEKLSERKYFDLDNDGTDDLEKLGILLNGVFKGLIPPFLAGVDWSEPLPYTEDPSVLRAYLEGPQPDGIDFNVILLLLHVLDMGTIRDLTWLPDNETLVYVDRMESQPEFEATILWPIRKNATTLTDHLGNEITLSPSGRPTYHYFNINQNEQYDVAVDKPFWYEDPASYIEFLRYTLNGIEVQTLRQVRADQTDASDAGHGLFQGNVDEWLYSPVASPDGKRIALNVGPAKFLVDTLKIFPILSAGDIITIDPRNSYVTRITSDGLDNRAPCWVPR